MVGINTVSDAISSMNNGLLNDVSLVRTKDISMVPSESAMFVNFEENAIKGIHEETGLSSIYFSTGNMELLQKAIRYEVQQKTGKIIDKQSPNELSVVMRSIYLQNGNPMVHLIILLVKLKIKYNGNRLLHEQISTSITT